MATLAQIHELNDFMVALPEAERESLSIDALYKRWREQKTRAADVQAIKEALDDLNRGVVGRPVDEFLAEFDEQRAAIARGRN